MRIQRYLVLGAFLFVSTATAYRAEAGIMSFTDGAHHVIDYGLDIGVKVSIGGTGTELEVVDGADIIDGIDAYGDSRITVSGGEISNRITASGSVLRDNSRLTLTGGTIRKLRVADDAQADIYGGYSVYLNTWNDARVNFYGGDAWEIYAWDNSQISVYGGPDYLERLGLGGASSLMVSGHDFWALGENDEHISLTEGLYLAGDLPTHDSLGMPVSTIGGIYEDGTAFEFNQRGELLMGNASLLLVSDVHPVPLPASALLGVFAVSLAGWRLRRGV
jgi:hypothetical protein